MRSTLTVIFAIVLAATAAHAARNPNDAKVHALLADGERRWAEGTPEQRRTAISLYEEAALLAPRDTHVLDVLGRACLEAVYLRQARGTFERSLTEDPNDADAEFGIGQMWMRTWLEKPDTTGLAMAVAYLTDATNDRPDFAEAWLARTALAIERGDPEGARDAGARALAVAPRKPEAQIAMAFLWYRAGEPERADSLFTVAIPLLPKALRRAFTDLSPLLSEYDLERYTDMNPNEQDDFAQHYWDANDPDPTTPINEARIEYWSRLAYAATLFGDPFDPHWRARTEHYLRYGNRVQVADEFGGSHHEMPVIDMGDVAAAPSPEALRRLGLLATSDGHAVFAPLPPGMHGLPLSTLVARFENELGGRLLAQVETPGTPADTLVAECVVLDSLGHEAGRSSRTMTAGACDPATLRTADFAFNLAPARYRVAFAVRNTRAGKGLSRVEVILDKPARTLAMSDVVLACGTLDAAASQGSVRLNPNLAARVGDDEPLHAYFEVYRLRTGEKGASRFDYEYTVQSTAADRRPWYRRLLPGGPPALLSYRSEQQGVGALRRQYINVPAGQLPYGHYRLVISVHDLFSGRKTSQTVEFDKEPAKGGK